MNAPVAIPALAAQYRQLREAILAEYPDIDPETLADTLDGATDAQDAVVSLVRLAREAEAWATAAYNLATDYKSRGARHEARGERLSAVALSLMEAMGEKNIKRPEFTVFVSHRKGRLEVYDEEQLPEAFFKYKTVRSVDRDKLEAASEPPPGTRMSNGSTSLVVRLK